MKILKFMIPFLIATQIPATSKAQLFDCSDLQGLEQVAGVYYCLTEDASASEAAGFNGTAPAKAAFQALSSSHREELQFYLKKLGLYDSRIDGRWGRNTHSALRKLSISVDEREALETHESALRFMQAIILVYR